MEGARVGTGGAGGGADGAGAGGGRWRAAGGGDDAGLVGARTGRRRGSAVPVGFRSTQSRCSSRAVDYDSGTGSGGGVARD
eukprot:scaffold94389_cov115-Phaeocystis_antarctica.AAC.1